MKDMYTRISLVRLCRLLGITRQAYYQHFWQQEATGIENALVLQQVTVLRKDHRVMGGRKLYEKLHPFLLDHGIKMGRDALFDLLAANGLLVKKTPAATYDHLVKAQVQQMAKYYTGLRGRPA